MKLRKNTKMNKNLERLVELKKQKKTIEDEIWELECSIKDYMIEKQVEEIFGTEYSAKCSKVITHKVDVSELKRLHPQIAKECTVKSEYWRLVLKAPK